jgi:hypothetical protein
MPTDQLRRGTLTDWSGGSADSMAREIENALQQFFGPFPPIAPDDRRNFCLAIAHGVLNHLRAHPQAFEVRVTIGGSTYTGTVTSIAVT